MIFIRTKRVPKQTTLVHRDGQIFAASQREIMVKESIIGAALDLFSRYGIKSVSMEDVAGAAGISKRTLYGYFEDKEGLLGQALIYRGHQLIGFLDQLKKEGHSALDTVLLFYEELLLRAIWFSEKFYEDMKKYPHVIRTVEEERSRFTSRCFDLFEQGVEEGLFRGDVNVELLVLLAKEQFRMRHPSKEFSKHSNAEIFTTVLLTFLRGICTDKGGEILDGWVRKREWKNVRQER